MISEEIKSRIDEYVNFEYEGRKIHLPYVLDQARWRFWRTCGKGSPSEIKDEISKFKDQEGLNLDQMSDAEITRWLREKKIGIECSGFVYNVLGLSSTTILRYPGFFGQLEAFILKFKRRHRISADILTNDLNTVPVVSLGDIRPGDLIRLTPKSWQGKHVAVVVEITSLKITYAHSSRETCVQGPHYGEIEILDSTRDLSQQRWLEVTRDGQNYGILALHPENGDGVRRLKCRL